MSGYLTDVQAGLALSASWGHPEMLQLQDNRWNSRRQAGEFSIRLGRRNEWVHDADRTIQPIVLEILSDDLIQPKVFRIGPQMGVEPAQPIRRPAANRSTNNRIIWIKNRELLQKFFRLSQSVGLRENNMAANRACDCGDELDDGLVGDA
jgi:hypothetical protein